MMTASWFTALMELMFGRDWPSIAGKRLKRTPKTLRRWGETGPPRKAWADIFRLVEHHLGEIGTYYDEMRQHGPL